MPKKILIVDEDMETIKLKRGIFHFLRFDVESAGSGEEAIEKAKKGGIDIVLSDTPLPCLTGEQFVEMMKGDHSTKDIPIIMLAPLYIRSEKRKLKAKGVSEYMVKPINIETLIKKVRNLIDNPTFYSNN